MFKKGLISLYKLIDRRQRLFPRGINKVFELGDVKLNVNLLDSGGMYYQKQTMEVYNRLYQLIQDDLKPEIILDIGANYGFISLIAHKYMPQAFILAVEPDPKLYPYIEKNLEEDGLVIFEVKEALCGDELKECTFSVNPASSQDNRVNKKGWKKMETVILAK